MMNKNVEMNVKQHEFIAQDRIRLFTERNNYKLDLYYEKKRNRVVIALLMAIIIALLGALLYVFYG